MTTGPCAPHRQIKTYNTLEVHVGAPRSGANVDQATGDMLMSLAMGESGLLGEAVEMREQLRADSTLEPKTFALVKIAALVALDAPPASYLFQVQAALDTGASAREILGVLTAIAPQTGMPRVVAAAPEIMIALGLELPADAGI
jgi:4-carboxymuconolactone decarboxylase